MSEQPADHWSVDTDSWDDEPAQARPEPTGVAPVDAVMDAVAGLDDRPLEEHVGVFETAHAELRRTLDS